LQKNKPIETFDLCAIFKKMTKEFALTEFFVKVNKSKQMQKFIPDIKVWLK